MAYIFGLLRGRFRVQKLTSIGDQLGVVAEGEIFPGNTLCSLFICNVNVSIRSLMYPHQGRTE